MQTPPTADNASATIAHTGTALRPGRGHAVLESLAVFVIGVVLMNFIYAGDLGVTSGELGAPGHDSFYHVKMAAMIPTHGLLQNFPWLRFCYFTNEGQDFISHHYGFHLWLVPFVYASHWLTGDYLTGGRWAMACSFGLSLMLFNLVLMSGRVRWRWLWLILFMVMPFQLFTRHAYIRAIGPSLVFMLLIILFMFRKRFILTGLAIALYIHLYLGGVLYGPLLVGLYVFSSIAGPRDDRAVPWRLIIWSVAGWIVGIVTHPYLHGMAEFLRLQVFGSGLSPDISVGREWRPYEGVWWFAQMSGVMLIIAAIAVAARLRHGPRTTAPELFLLLVNFAFLTLTFKARRFIEYWPVFNLLCAAYLLVPVLDAVAAWHDRSQRPEESRRSRWLELVTPTFIAVGMAVAAERLSRTVELGPFLNAWPAWTALIGLYLVGPLALIWGGAPLHAQRRLAGIAWRLSPLFAAGLFVGIVTLLVRLGLFPSRNASPGFAVGYLGWLVLGGWYLAVPNLMGRAFEAKARGGWFIRSVDTLRVIMVAVACFAGVIAVAGYPWSEIQRQTRCGYDLPAIREAMTFLKEHSEPGDVIFTDDWDIFPVFFYFNSHDHYIVGLDPKFTQARRPELWERYVKISRGQVPAATYVDIPDESGAIDRRQIHVQLTDIRDHFGARFVITDQDHKTLAAKLAEAEDFAELIYPPTSYEAARAAAYLIFRVRESGVASDDAKETPPPLETPDTLYLSSLAPLAVTQGWGDFVTDRSVEGGPIHLGGHVYDRGLGTHAPSRLVYAIPENYAFFEAVVGVDRDTDGEGSIVASVRLDDELVLTTGLLTGLSEPEAVRIPLGNARKLTLEADCTSDGKRFDHVDWADARFNRGPDHD